MLPPEISVSFQSLLEIICMYLMSSVKFLHDSKIRSQNTRKCQKSGIPVINFLFDGLTYNMHVHFAYICFLLSLPIYTNACNLQNIHRHFISNNWITRTDSRNEQLFSSVPRRSVVERLQLWRDRGIT